MRNIFGLVLILVVGAGLLAASGALYTVDETQQVVVTRFGEPIGRPVTEAGLHFKMPVAEQANYFDKRILPWDGDPTQIPTLDKRYIWVDTTARWRIIDALKFMKSVGNFNSAQARLDDIIDAATRDAVSSLNLIESIRSSNGLLEEMDDKTDAEIEIDFELSQISRERVSVGRNELTRRILRDASTNAPKYGIELVDVRIKRINYVNEVQQKVFERMISERHRAAEQFRSEGQGKKAEIEGQMAKELKEIRSEAYKTAQELKGKADAEVIRLYADAYNKDPEFYSFTKALETYKKTIGKDTSLILTTESDLYEYLKDID